MSWGIQERFSRDHQSLGAVINQELENLEFYVSKQAMHRLCGAGTGSTVGILKRVMTSAKRMQLKQLKARLVNKISVDLNTFLLHFKYGAVFICLF